MMANSKSLGQVVSMTFALLMGLIVLVRHGGIDFSWNQLPHLMVNVAITVGGASLVVLYGMSDLIAQAAFEKASEISFGEKAC